MGAPSISLRRGSSNGVLPDGGRNGIMGMTELALGTELTKEQRELLVTIESSAESLLSLINDILDFSKIEAKKVELDPIDFELRERIGETLSTLAARAHE